MAVKGLWLHFCSYHLVERTYVTKQCSPISRTTCEVRSYEAIRRTADPVRRYQRPAWRRETLATRPPEDARCAAEASMGANTKGKRAARLKGPSPQGENAKLAEPKREWQQPMFGLSVRFTVEVIGSSLVTRRKVEQLLPGVGEPAFASNSSNLARYLSVMFAVHHPHGVLPTLHQHPPQKPQTERRNRCARDRFRGLRKKTSLSFRPSAEHDLDPQKDERRRRERRKQRNPRQLLPGRQSRQLSLEEFELVTDRGKIGSRLIGLMQCKRVSIWHEHVMPEEGYSIFTLGKHRRGRRTCRNCRPSR